MRPHHRQALGDVVAEHRARGHRGRRHGHGGPRVAAAAAAGRKRRGRATEAGMDGKKKNKRRGAAAKQVNKVDTRVIVQKISRNRKKAVTHIVGMDTVPGLKLKEASKAFSKRFAGSSSVKDKEIIIQGDHLEDVAEMIVNKFGVNADAVFLDLDGEFVSYG